jgi:hypothetical protein
MPGGVLFRLIGTAALVLDAAVDLKVSTAVAVPFAGRVNGVSDLPSPRTGAWSQAFVEAKSE